MELSKPKVFEKPDGGLFYGTIIDVVDMPNVPSTYNGVVTLKNKVRILWVLNKQDSTPALDKEGKQLTVAGFYNAVLADNSNLMKVIRQILNGQPPLMTNTDQVADLLLGRQNQLFLVKAENKRNPADPYTNIAGITPLAPGQIAPAGPPQGFVREKFRPKEQAGPQGAPVQTYPTPQAAAAAQPVAPAPAPTANTLPAPTPEQIAAWYAAQQQQKTVSFAPPATPGPNKDF